MLYKFVINFVHFVAREPAQTTSQGPDITPTPADQKAIRGHTFWGFAWELLSKTYQNWKAVRGHTFNRFHLKLT